MICFDAWWRLLKVWKNSSWERSRLVRKWMSSMTRTSTSRKRWRKSAISLLATLSCALGHKPFAGRVVEHRPRIRLDDLEADSLEQVGLPEPHAAVDKVRVVRAARVSGDRQSRGMGQAIARTHHKVVKGVVRIDHQRLVPVGVTGFCSNDGGRPWRCRRCLLRHRHRTGGLGNRIRLWLSGP